MFSIQTSIKIETQNQQPTWKFVGTRTANGKIWDKKGIYYCLKSLSCLEWVLEEKRNLEIRKCSHLIPGSYEFNVKHVNVKY